MTGLIPNLWIKNKTFLKDAGTSLAGTVLAQAIAFAAQPILRRYYTPEMFGELSVFLSLTGLFASIATFRYELALMLPSSDIRCLQMLLGAFILNSIFSFFLGIIYFFCSGILSKVLNTSETFACTIPLSAVAVWAYGNFLLVQNYLSKHRQYKFLNQIRALRRGSEVSAQWILSFLSSYGLVLGELMGRLIMSLTGLGFIFRKLKDNRLKTRETIKLLLVFKKFPTYSLFPTFLNSLALLAPGLLVNFHFGTYQNGIFDMSLQILVIPIGLTITTLGNVILSEISSRYRKKEPIFPFLRLNFFILLGFALVITGVLWIVGPTGFKLLFGNPYEKAWSYALLLLPGLTSRLVTAPLAVFFAGVNQIQKSVWWQYLYALIVIGLFFYPFDDVEKFIITYSLAEFLLNSLYLWQIFRTCKTMTLEFVH